MISHLFGAMTITSDFISTTSAFNFLCTFAFLRNHTAINILFYIYHISLFSFFHCFLFMIIAWFLAAYYYCRFNIENKFYSLIISFIGGVNIILLRCKNIIGVWYNLHIYIICIDVTKKKFRLIFKLMKKYNFGCYYLLSGYYISQP